MTAINSSINFIKSRIPKEILNIAFMTAPSLIGKVTNIDKQIETMVIKHTVLNDLNIIKGQTYTIDVNKCKQYHINYNETGNYLIIEVPYALTDNREIIDTLSLMYNPFINNNQHVGTNSNSGMQLASMAMDAVDTNVGGLVTSNLSLIGPNTILVSENILGGVMGKLRISVEHDEEMRAIRSKAVLTFRKICLLAVQAYIHNELIISFDKGYIYGGHDLSKVTDIVDGYESAWEEYDELLNSKWRKTMFINDSEAYDRYLKIGINPVN